jgi:hypothetical protein
MALAIQPCYCSRARGQYGQSMLVALAWCAAACCRRCRLTNRRLACLTTSVPAKRNSEHRERRK